MPDKIPATCARRTAGLGHGNPNKMRTRPQHARQLAPDEEPPAQQGATQPELTATHGGRPGGPRCSGPPSRFRTSPVQQMVHASQQRCSLNQMVHCIPSKGAGDMCDYEPHA
eukprot:4970601-Prymnesium_polylepis.2